LQQLTIEADDATCRQNGDEQADHRGRCARRLQSTAYQRAIHSEPETRPLDTGQNAK
jgi:hypothetical protein